MDKNIGRKLDGRYEITELIGIGGMAEVYKAVDIIDDKVVAVKILKNEFSNDEEFLRRFRNESKAIAVLSHPNIVKIYDVGFTEKIQFIVMEYIDGITLKEFMEQQGVLKWKDAIHFIIQVLRALQHAHDRGIVHRDIKPQNIMLFPDGTIKVMDFGIARFAREEGKTFSDKAIGSVHYISPEQARGDITDEKSDIYSVGVMLYEMLTGQKPFDADNPVSVALMHMQTKAKNPREINETIPEGLEDIVVRAMYKEASKRYQSASEMIKDIEEFKRNPSIVFEYKYLTPSADESTIYFQPVSEKSKMDKTVKINKEKPKVAKKKAAPKYEEYDEEYDDEYDYYDDDDDDDDDSRGRSLIVPVLVAITAAVVIIAAFFITNAVIDMLGMGDTESYNMPNLVGMTLDEAKSKYSHFTFEIADEEYSEYEAGVIIEQQIRENSTVKAIKPIKVTVSKGIRMVAVPDVANYEQTRAKKILEDAGFYVATTSAINEDITQGFIVSTDPVGGSTAKYGSTVTMIVSLGPEMQDVIVPQLVGMTKEEAEKALIEKNLVPVIEEKDSTAPVGEVVAQSINHMEVVQPDTEITIYVSTGTAAVNSYYMNVPITQGSTGGYTFKAYIDGDLVDSVSKGSVTSLDYVTMTVRGSGTKSIIVEITSYTGSTPIKLAEYMMNFDTGEYYEVTYNEYAFADANL